MTEDNTGEYVERIDPWDFFTRPQHVMHGPIYVLFLLRCKKSKPTFQLTKSTYPPQTLM